MRLRSLGMSDVKITPIIMGTWQAGKRMWAGIDDAEITKAIRAAFDAGMTTFDTAEEYGWGHSERILGKALTDVRHQVVYATKVFPNHLNYDQVIGRCHRSLKNLNTHYIDLFQIHWPAGSWGTRATPIQETLRAMNKLLQQGKIRAIGVSNFSCSQLKEAAQFSRIDSLQPPYSLFWRHVEKETLPYCIKNNITVLAYSPMAQGILTGKFGPDHRFPKGDHRSKNKLFQKNNFNRVQQALNKLRPIADRYGFSLGQLALAWVISHQRVCAIAGARNAEQVIQNAKAADVHLSDTDIKEMDTISRSVTDYLDDNPVMWKF